MKIILFTISGAAEPVIKKLVSQGTPPAYVVPPKDGHFLREKTIVLAHKYNIPVIMFNTDPSEEMFVKRINEIAPDLILVASFSHLIPESVYSAASIAAINAHPSLLPEYRGANPSYHVIANGESHTGVTLHLLDNQFDTGAILQQISLPISPQDTAGTITVKLDILMANELGAIVDTIKDSGLPKGSPQSNQSMHTAPRVHPPSDCINWEEPAQDIDRIIRANNPYHFICTRLNDLDVILFSGGLVDTSTLSTLSENARYGEIVAIDEFGVILKTGDGAYRITSLSYGTVWVGDTVTLAKLGLIKVGDCFESKS